MEQITIAEWQQWKQDIKDRLNQTVENFIAIGYRLRQIRDTEAYRNDGYTSLSEFAQKEFSLSDSTVNRFMAINAKFTVGGSGTELLPEFKGISYSKLQEMLTLSDEDCKLITANTTVKEIRELKNFNHDDEAKYILPAGQQPSRTPLQDCIWDFFSAPGNKSLLEEVIETIGGPFGAISASNIADTISPSGNRTHRKGIVYLFLYDYDRGVTYKLMTSPMPIKLKWEEFLEEIRKTYADYMSSEGSIWEAAYGSLPGPETQIPGQMDITQMEPGSSKKPEPKEPKTMIKKESEKNPAPATSQKIENITDRAEIVEKAPEDPSIPPSAANGTAREENNTGGTDAGESVTNLPESVTVEAQNVPKASESVPKEPENVINTKCGEPPIILTEDNTSSLMSEEEIEETWLDVDHDSNRINSFTCNYFTSDLVDNKVPLNEIKDAYHTAVSLAAGIEKLMINIERLNNQQGEQTCPRA